MSVLYPKGVIKYLLYSFYTSNNRIMDTNSPVLFKQGAEGRIYIVNYLGKSAILKERLKKKYRNPELDNNLTKERIRAEAKSILRCKNAGIYTPSIYLTDLEKRRIIMEYLENTETVSDFIVKWSTNNAEASTKKLIDLSTEIGTVIGKMHFNDIIHGDLTTSNMLVKYTDEENWNLYLIDFGLSYTKSSDEDKAVDLYVLERALTSKHCNVEWFFDNILNDYVKFHKNNEKILRKLSEVRSRGRKRTMVG